jgi:hypothetical protein
MAEHWGTGVSVAAYSIHRTIFAKEKVCPLMLIFARLL